MSEKQDHDTHYHELEGSEAREKVGTMIKDIRIAMMTTLAADGTLDSRPMAVQEKVFDGTLWFLTRASSGKVGELGEDSDVTLTFAEPKNSTYLALKGRGTVSVDRAKIHELWSPLYQAWFPRGEDDPDIAVLRVDVVEGNYWEASNSRLVTLAKYAFAAATHGKMPVGEAGHVQV